MLIKGFYFLPGNRAFERIFAADCDRIYGDTFKIVDNRFVQGIGNNVSLEFDEMDFSADGASKLVVYGRSALDKNTIHIRFAHLDGESNRLVEFRQADVFEEQVFDLEPVAG